VPKSNVLLAAELKELGGLGTNELRQRWASFTAWRQRPRISRELLIAPLPIVIQVEAHGDLARPLPAPAGAPG